MGKQEIENSVVCCGEFAKKVPLESWSRPFHLGGEIGS